MQPTEAQKKFVRSQITKYKKHLFINRFSIDVCYHSETEDKLAAATVKAKPEYFKATICIEPAFWDQPKEDQKHIILHELCHIIPWELGDHVEQLLNGNFISQDQLSKTTERTTEHIAMIIESLL